MSDFYESMLRSGMGRKVLNTVGLPTPIALKRYSASQATFLSGDVLVGASLNSELIGDLLRNLGQSEAKVFFPSAAHSAGEIVSAADSAGV